MSIPETTIRGWPDGDANQFPNVMIDDPGDDHDIPNATMHQQRMAAVGEIAAGVAHEFRNVLQTLVSTLELIETVHANPQSVRRLAASGLRATERATGLANRFLALSRQEEEHRSLVNILPSVTEVAETLAQSVGARVKLGVENPPSDVWLTPIDPRKFELALLNLGINARDAMPEGGSMMFCIRNVTLPPVDRRHAADRGPAKQDRRGPSLRLPAGDYVSVAVSDTGRGMDAGILAQAMRPFFTTKPRGKGTGLGLSMVHGFATQHGGTFRLISQPGNGTTVEIWLPRAAA